MEFKMKPYTKETKLPFLFLAKVLESDKKLLDEKSKNINTYVVEYITLGKRITGGIELFDTHEDCFVEYSNMPDITEYADLRVCITITEWCPIPAISIKSNLNEDDIYKLNKAFDKAWSKPLEVEK